MKPFKIRIPTHEGAVGRVGYVYLRGTEEGRWKITAKQEGEHDEVAECDVPDACWPAFVDHTVAWLEHERQRRDENIAIVRSWPDVRPGWRIGWKNRELSREMQSWQRCVKSVVKVMTEARKILEERGWPVGTMPEIGV